VGHTLRPRKTLCFSTEVPHRETATQPDFDAVLTLLNDEKDVAGWGILNLKFQLALSRPCGNSRLLALQIVKGSEERSVVVCAVQAQLSRR
jgi:hypothetical protein